MKALICGGTRFYGKKLTEGLISRGHDVVVISRNISDRIDGVRYICGELSRELTKNELSNECFDVCIANILMTKSDAENYLKSVKKIAKKHIIISSIGVYNTRETKETAYNPYIDGDNIGFYQEKKQVEKTIVSSVNRNNVLILRPAIIIGENDWTHRMEFYIQRIKDSGGIITQSKNNYSLSFVYDWQLAKTVIYFIEKGWKSNNNIFNVAVSKKYSYIELLKIIMKCLLVTETKLLRIDLNKTPVPYDEFRDPYGKSNNSCNVSNLCKVNRDLVEYDDTVLFQLIKKLISSYKIEEVPNYSFREQEIRYLNINDKNTFTI